MEDGGPSFPPLLSGEATDGDPFALAVARAKEGTDAGLITHRVRPDRLAAAVVLAPETPLRDALAMVLAAMNGFADAFGALSPSEVACQFVWPGGIRINGARCGSFRAAASTTNPANEPDWLVIGFEVPFFAEADAEPGDNPEETTLWDEGCSEIEPLRLLESWSRHLLVWIHEWEETGMSRLHEDWLGRAFTMGEDTAVTLGGRSHEGTMLGLDEAGGLLLKTGTGTELVPLTEILEEV
ncbi:MAG: DUF4444 domain-containing protein [Rhodobacteraceae bacterium]|nr:DUF4444 domain-containing protein [Paracoccaceae bacterium]